MSLYLLINVLTIFLPLLLSFDKKVHFYTYWKYFLPAMLITMALFIFWDVLFTQYGVWGFNEKYHTGWTFFGLPLEEYLFFITVPYASVFTIYVIDAYFPETRLRTSQVRLVSFVLILILFVLSMVFIRRSYTAVNFAFSALLIALVMLKNPRLLSQFYISYLVILIPFGLVNGILTGSFIEGQVVWYNDLENLGIRLGTIPFEDVFYGMNLILLNYFLLETFRRRDTRKTNKSP